MTTKSSIGQKILSY